MTYRFIYRDLYYNNSIPFHIQGYLLQQWHTFTYTAISTTAMAYLYIYSDLYYSNGIPFYIQRSLLRQ